MKACSRCRVSKPAKAFAKMTASKDGRQYACRECQKKIWKEYKESTNRADYYAKYEARPDVRAKRAAYRARPENKLRAAEYQREWLTDPKNRARHYKAVKKWLASPKGRFYKRFKEDQRREREYRAPGKFTLEDWKRLLKNFGAACLACGSQKKLTADHVVPVVQGGSHNFENRQPLCLSCNSRKGARVVDYRIR